MKTRHSLFLLPAISLATAFGGDAPTRPDVLFVLVDSLKASHVGCYGYARDTTPNLDRFVREEGCFRFETVIPGGSWTMPAVMTLFTAMSVDGHRRVMPDLPHNRDAVTLAEALRAAGYATVGITANAMTNRRFGYGKGFDVWDDYSATLPPDASVERMATGYARGAAVTQMGLGRLRRRDPDKPLFLFLFYMDPHWDYSPPPPYDAKFAAPGGGPIKNAWTLPAAKATPDVRRRTVGAYDGEIAYCDFAISNLLASVAATPRWNDTIVVIAGDHGESFWERGFAGHGNDLHDGELKVPLILRVPKSCGLKAAGGVVKGQVGGLDVAPTILDLAGVPVPGSWEGRSLRDAMETGASDGRPVVSETRVRDGLWQRSVRTDRWKVIAIDDFKRPVEAYDLVADPGETNNLVRAECSLPEEMRRLLPLLKPRGEEQQGKAGGR